jgi:hypothetical protein
MQSNLKHELEIKLPFYVSFLAVVAEGNIIDFLNPLSPSIVISRLSFNGG